MKSSYISHRWPDAVYRSLDGGYLRMIDADLPQHTPTRTPTTHPYGFDPHTVDGYPGPHPECNQTLYGDRLQAWDYTRYEGCLRRMKAEYPQLSLASCVGAQAFLVMFTGDSELRVLRVIRYCCTTSGFSIYRYDIHNPKIATHNPIPG